MSKNFKYDGRFSDSILVDKLVAAKQLLFKTLRETICMVYLKVLIQSLKLHCKILEER